MQVRREAGREGGMQGRRDAGQDGFRTGGMQGMGRKTRGIQDRRETGKEGSGYKGCGTGEML